jgi:hypothetical protein
MACDPAARLREIAASLGITERSAYAIIIDLTEAGAELAGVPRGAGRQGGGRGRARRLGEGDGTWQCHPRSELSARLGETGPALGRRAWLTDWW